MGRLTAAWSRHWFEPASPLGLGACRIAFYAALLACYAGKDLAAWGDVSPVFWSPVLPARALGVAFAPTETLIWVQRAFILALALSCVGLATRASTAAAAVLGYYVLGVYTFGREAHAEAIAVSLMAIMACSRAGDALSLDRALFLRSRPPPAPSGEYRWPIQAARLAIAFVFLGAGISKFRHSGLAWITTDNLRNWIVERTYDQGRVRSGLSTWVGRSPLLCKLLAAGTVALECLFPLALFSRRAALVLIPAAVGMLAGFSLILGPTFVELGAAAIIFWLPWDRLGRGAPPTPAAP